MPTTRRRRVALIALVIVAGTWDLFRESVDLALDAVPRGIDPAAVAAGLAGIDGVTHVRDLKIWGASTAETSLTAHLVVPDASLHPAALAAARHLLHERFHIDHTTLELDVAEQPVRDCRPRRPDPSAADRPS